MSGGNLAKKETIVYGGAFNPPTRAHHAILQACIDHAELHDADVWVMPCGNRVHKTIDAPREKRVRYVEALLEDIDKRTVEVRMETTELDRKGLMETYDTAVTLSQEYPDREFVWVFGADSVATIESWKNGKWLRENLLMLVVNRPGSDPGALGPNVTYLDVATTSVSSTEVRAKLAASEPVDDLVTPSVLAYLYS